MTVSLAQLLNPKVVEILNRPIDQTLTLDDAQALIPLANAALPAHIPASDSMIERCLAPLSIMPSQLTDPIKGSLKLKTYLTMLAGISEGALKSACRKCLDELTFFPSIKEIKDRAAKYVSPEEAKINRARYLLRTAPRIKAEPPPLTQAEVDALKPDMIALGLKIGALVKNGDGTYAPAN